MPLYFGGSGRYQCAMSDILAKIKAYKLEHVAGRKTAWPVSAVEDAARQAPPVRGFAASLARATEDGYGLIAEIKKASPSRGLIRADFDPALLAAAYERGGATCLSVLTDGPSFQGDDAYLAQARAACRLPALRKDFLYDPYQVAESRALHADCILIIMASVSDAQAAELEEVAYDWGMDVLVEVHDRAELDRALALRSPLIGINNRDLRSFETSLDTTATLAPFVPPGRIPVCESGLFTPQDLARMAGAGVRAFLIGESLMRQADVEGATRNILADPVPAWA
jgi:indole-3-glycerol phosphate synthase